MGINALGHIINSAGDFGPMIFGTGERLLLPFGLHHILVALIASPKRAAPWTCAVTASAAR
jgi:phosphotransferase system  glucose/maltose/N-acetylglucosamine-specific IIC component